MSGSKQGPDGRALVTNMLDEEKEKIVLYLLVLIGIVGLVLTAPTAVNLHTTGDRLPELYSLSYKEGELSNIFKYYPTKPWRYSYDIGISINGQKENYYLDRYVLRNIYHTASLRPSLNEAEDTINRQIKNQKTNNIKIWHFESSNNFKEIAQLIVGDAVIISYEDYKLARKEWNSINGWIFTAIALFMIWATFGSLYTLIRRKKYA